VETRYAAAVTFPVCQWLARTGQSPQNVYANRVLFLPVFSSGADCHVADHVQAKSIIITGDIETVRASCKAPEAGTAPSA